MALHGKLDNSCILFVADAVDHRAYNYPNGFTNELEYPANRVLQDTGVVAMGSYNWDASSPPWTISPTFEDQIGINAGTAVARLTASYNNETILTAAEEASAYDAIDIANGRILDSASLQQDYFDALFALADTVKASVGSFSYPKASVKFVTTADPEKTFIVMLENDLAYGLPAQSLKAHPSHSDFPGATPSSASPVTRTFTFNGNFEGLNRNLIYAGSGSGKWHSTGLYLPAGATANVTIASGLIGADLSIQVRHVHMG
jgi:hypothetical protein